VKTLFLILFFYLLAANTPCRAQNGTWIKWESQNPKLASDWKIFQDSVKRNVFLDSISRVFQEEGFLELVINQKYFGKDSLYVELVPGPKYAWGKVNTEEVPSPLVDELGPIGKNYSSVFGWMDRLVQLVENQGYPFATAKLDHLKLMSDSIQAKIKFEYGPFIKWDSISVIGQTKTSSRYIQNLTGIVPGNPFSQLEFEKSITTLKRSPYFSLVNPELGFQMRSARPTYTLRDRNVNVLDGIIGFLPNENKSQKMLITGQVDLELYHLGGKGRDIEMHWQRLNVLSQFLEVKAKEAFLFNSPLDITLGFDLLKQDTSFLSRNFSLDLGYRIKESGYINFFTKRVSSNLISTNRYQNANNLPEVADFNWNQYGLGMSWDKLDSPDFPRKGYFVKWEFSAGNKEIRENTALPQEIYQDVSLNSPQYLGKIDLTKHYYLLPSWGIMVSVSGGFVKNQNLLLNDLFRLGGLKSIRGFNENYFFARSYGYLNMEQRLFFGENSFLMIFADLGMLENPYFAVSIDKPFSIGAGINLNTGPGMFRFIYAVGKSNFQPFSFSFSRIHFGYLARF
jgi:outer membrane protein assembly factor BamA